VSTGGFQTWKAVFYFQRRNNLMDIQELTNKMHDFVRSKGWYEPGSSRPQTPRNLAISLSLEANEVLEHFQWNETPIHKDELAGEMADVALYLLQLASISGIDLEQAVLKKLAENADREWDQNT
jgi:8-oxo-dGTP diphosphatase